MGRILVAILGVIAVAIEKFPRRIKGIMVKEKAQSVEELEHNGVSVIRTIAVREKSYWNEGVCFRSAWDAAEFAKPLFENADKEYLLVCCLDGKLQPVSMEVVAMGMVNQCLVGMREVFKMPF